LDLLLSLKEILLLSIRCNVLVSTMFDFLASRKFDMQKSAAVVIIFRCCNEVCAVSIFVAAATDLFMLFTYCCS